jgi:homoserine O-succinyltransferase
VLRVAFVNNMPDAAFADTERQFVELLERASQGGPLLVDRYLVESVPRAASVLQGPAAAYRRLHGIYATRPDAIIVTGTEPVAPTVAEEPLWGPLTELFTWATGHTSSLLCSCLAAHTAVRHFDGLERTLLDRKCWGLLPDRVDRSHVLGRGLPETVSFPHSRCNEVSLEPLRGLGYEPVLDDGSRWTVATAVRGEALLVLVQGHPEYGPDSLLREYRRDVRRYLRGERDSFPPLPEHYLSGAARTAVEQFADAAHAGPRDERAMLAFPFEEVMRQMDGHWSTWADTLYANWLGEVRRRVSDEVLAEAQLAV